VDIILKIFLSIPVSNISAEISFSVFKRVENCIRNSTGQEKLSNLAVIYIENDITNRIDYNELI
jgi:hypothetical protein